MSCAVLLALAMTWTIQAGSDAELVKAWIKVCQNHAGDFRIFPAENRKAEFKLLPRPVFRHSQPVRGDQIGALFLWVQGNGRPAVIGDVFAHAESSLRGGSRTVLHEMHSLAPGPVTAVWRETRRTVKAVFEWKPIPDAPAPADSAAGRLRQVRLLSRSFNAHSIDSRGGRWELRLIPKPLYQYEMKEGDSILGGALLAFCQGTDTEIVLCVEARRTGDGKRWHYGCADFSDYGLYMRLGEAEVWKSPRDFMSGLKWTPKLRGVTLPKDDKKRQKTQEE